MMFVSVLLPFVDRGSGPLFHWVMLAQMARFDAEDIVFIGDAAYFEESSVPFGDWLKLGGLRFCCPDIEKFRAFRKIQLAPELFSDLIARFGGNHLELFQYLLTKTDTSLEDCLAEYLRELAHGSEIEAVLSWCNFPALSAAAGRTGDIPVIHNELGPLRAPLYQDTVYFDFRGVNGGTSPPTWSQSWVEAQMSGASLLEPDRLRGLLVADSARVQALEYAAPAFRAGVALQVEDDSNIVAYANGWLQLDLLYDVMGRFGVDQLSVRGHPGAHFTYRGGLGQVDTSPDSLAFLASIEKLVSINSSLLAEAALWGRRFEAKGDTPVRFLSSALSRSEAEWQRLALNAFFLAYLVPVDLLFDPAYYRWRLSKPTLAECHQRHVATLGRSSPVAIDGLSGDASLNIPSQAGLVRLPALWTGTLSLERSLERAVAQHEQSRYQAALREMELLAQLAGERERAKQWEAEANKNSREAELLGERLHLLEARQARTSNDLDGERQLVKRWEAEAKESFRDVELLSERLHVLEARHVRMSNDLDVEVQRARLSEELHSKELARGREVLQRSESERELLQARSAVLVEAIEELIEWMVQAPRQLAGFPDLPSESLPSPLQDAGSGQHSAVDRLQNTLTSEWRGPEIEAVLLSHIARLSGRILALGKDGLEGDEKCAAEPDRGGQDYVDISSTDSLARIRWVREQLRILYAELADLRWRYYCSLQGKTKLEADISSTGAILTKALISSGFGEGWTVSDGIGRLALGVEKYLEQLRAQLESATRPPAKKTLREKIFKPM